MSHCAICTSSRGPFTPQPLGRNNALVPVCSACDEPAFEQRGPERGYEPSGGLLKAGELTASMRSVMGDAEYERQMRDADEYGRASAPATEEADRLIREHNYENTRRHYARTNYANRTAAEKARR